MEGLVGHVRVGVLHGHIGSGEGKPGRGSFKHRGYRMTGACPRVSLVAEVNATPLPWLQIAGVRTPWEGL